MTFGPTKYICGSGKLSLAYRKIAPQTPPDPVFPALYEPSWYTVEIKIAYIICFLVSSPRGEAMRAGTVSISFAVMALGLTSHKRVHCTSHGSFSHAGMVKPEGKTEQCDILGSFKLLFVPRNHKHKQRLTESTFQNSGKRSNVYTKQMNAKSKGKK